MRTIDTIVLHHAVAPVTTSAAAIRRYHTRPRHESGRGWRDIGYHWVIRLTRGDISGHPRTPITEAGRPEEQIGAHCIPVQRRSIGVCVCGNWSEWHPDAYSELWDHVVTELASLARRHGVPVDMIRGHSEVQPGYTECPGLNVDMVEIRQRVADLLVAP